MPSATLRTRCDTNTQLGDKPCLAQTRAQYGAVLLEHGAPEDRERALELLELALDAAEEMGMKKVVKDCLALKLQLNASDHGTAPGLQPTGP